MRKFSEVIVGELISLPIGTTILRSARVNNEFSCCDIHVNDIDFFSECEVIKAAKDKVTLKMTSTCLKYNKHTNTSEILLSSEVTKIRQKKVVVLKKYNPSLF